VAFLQHYKINIVMIDNILKNRFTARSFADMPVDTGHLTQVLEILKIVPSKQNVYPYSLNIFGYEHSEVKEQLFKLTSCGEPIPDAYNPQVLAPLLFVWSYRPNENGATDLTQFGHGHTYEQQLHNSMIEVGMSAMAAMTKFHELGYVSGFCKCFNGIEAKNVLSISQEIILTMGVGYPSSDSRIGRSRRSPQYQTKPDFNTWITVR
jgi:nitroreductase